MTGLCNVYVLSSMDNRSAAIVIKSPKAAVKGHPTVIVEYNQFLGGVDLVDQHLIYAEP